jgi:hypothetical protein
MWDLDLIADLVARGLEDHAQALDAEQAVYGLDALNEIRLHAIVREALRAEHPPHPDGPRFGVLGEQRFPGDRLRAKRSEGERCDIVLLAPVSFDDDSTGGGTPGLPRRGESSESPWLRRLLDPLETGTLFEGLGVAPEDALWIEVKVAAQFALIDGVARANPRYSGVMLREVPGDARKLARDSVIRDGAVMVVMFNENEVTAAHDLEAWRVRALEKGWPVRTPIVRRFGISDRIGNGVVSVVVCATERG